jgi:hypothetical protein
MHPLELASSASNRKLEIVFMTRYAAERCCSVTRRQGCPNWNQDAIGAVTAAAWLARHFVISIIIERSCLYFGGELSKRYGSVLSLASLV